MAKQQESPRPGDGAAGPDEARQQFLDRMGQLYDRMLGRVGMPEDSFDEIEEHAMELGREASRQLMARRLEAEDRLVDGPQCCPRCGHGLRYGKGARPRGLETCAGVVPYERRHAYCDRCRSSFSPGGEKAEDAAPGRIERPDPPDM